MTITQKLRYFFFAVLGFACLVSIPNFRVGTVRYSLQVFRGMSDNDSTFYMDRAWAVVKAGKPLYQTLFFEQHLKFIYPSSSLLTYLLAERLHISGKLLIDALIYLALAGTLVMAGEIFLMAVPKDGVSAQDRRSCRLMVAGIGMIFFPLVVGVSTGQVQTLLTFLFTLAVYFWMRGGKARAGLCLALLCSFKPTFLVFLVWALVRREWRFFLGFAACFAAVQAMAVAAFGWQNEVDYVAVLNYIGHRGEALGANQTINGLLQRLTRNGNPAEWSRTVYPPFNRIVYLGTVLSSAALLGFGLLFPLGRKWKGQARDFIVFGLLATVATPIAWEHHYGSFYVASVYILAVSLGRSGFAPLHLAAIPASSHLFLLSFVLMANRWVFLLFGAKDTGNVMLSYNLFAGLAMVLVLAGPVIVTVPESEKEPVRGPFSSLGMTGRLLR